MKSMHVSLSRARQHQQGRLLTGAALTLAGAALVTSLFAIAPHAAQRADADAMITGSLPPKTTDIPYELRIEVTRPGLEGLELAGRLSEDGGLITLPIKWKVRRAASDGGMPDTTSNDLYEENSPITSMRIDPGSYEVEATYGSVSLVKQVEVPKSHHMSFTFVFNVGGLRTLSTIASEPLPGATRAVHKVYALNGQTAGQLVATSDVPGGLMRLGAGTYRLESEIEPGNTVTRTDVSIKPGLLTTLQLDHLAGVALIDAAGETRWIMSDGEQKWSATGAGSQVLTLAPGSYTWQAGGTRRTVIIEPGKRTQVQGR